MDDEQAPREMGNRGVSRPQMHTEAADGKEMKMSEQDRMEMLQAHHAQTLWIYWTLVLLGAWLLIFPLTFGYDTGIVQPSGGRQIWLSLGDRIMFMKWSDILSGAALMVFGWRCLRPNRPVSRWICCFIGIWITVAPVLFWSPTAAGYVSDTLVGMLVISLSILIPGMPGMLLYMKMGGTLPQGWTYNPSSWPQRWIMILTGFLGFVVSRYLAAFQLGYLTSVWDPVFGSSSEQVLNSAMSQSLFVSDAGLGAIAYTFEFLMGFMGSPARWRTMPWMVAFFGILVIPLGLVHIFLVISQPLTVGAWCLFCIVAAAIMLPMIPLEVDEVVAMGQHMVQASRRGEKLWDVFWKGGTAATEQQDNRTPELKQLPERPAAITRASVWGMSAPATLIIATVLGILVVFFPAWFGLPVKDRISDVFHLCGSLVVVCSVIAMGEVVRAIRWVNLLLGACIALLPWTMGAQSLSLKLCAVSAGILIALVSLPKGKITQQYGSWQRFIL